MYLNGSNVENELMSTHTILTLIEDTIILLQLLHHVVGIEHGYDGTLAYTLPTQLSYVGV